MLDINTLLLLIIIGLLIYNCFCKKSTSEISVKDYGDNNDSDNSDSDNKSIANIIENFKNTRNKKPKIKKRKKKPEKLRHKNRAKEIGF